MIISGEESNYRLLLECMEIYGCLFECKIEEIFKHYTDEIEAVQHAKDIEEAYVKIMTIKRIRNVCGAQYEFATRM